jgi:hypothetical protein
MTSREPSNIAASVQARLLNRSRETGENFQFLLNRYVAERFLYGQWRAYCRRNNLPGASLDFSVIGETLISFLAPIWRAIKDQTKFDLSWPTGGPWKLAGKG